MNKEQIKLSSNVCLIFKKNHLILLGKRKNSNWMNGFYACPGGKIDGMETVKSAAIREAQEELGVKIEENDLNIVHIFHLNEGSNLRSINFFIEVKNWEGKPTIMEPEKCEALIWLI